MKNKFKIFSILIMSLVFIISMSITTFAKTFQRKSGDVYKTWTFNFNKDVDVNTVNDNIIVENPKGNLVGSTIEASGTVARIKSATNGKFKESYDMKFTVAETIKENNIEKVDNYHKLLSVVEKRVENFKIMDEHVQEVYDKANEIINNVITLNMTEYEKEKALHDYIVKNTVYDYNNYLEDTIPKESYTPYGILIKNTGVCQGYAETMKLLLNMINIECKVISGEGNNGPHAWNKVKIDGKEYNLDVTWDDPVPDKGHNYVRYNYFNISDEQLSKDHDWDINVNLDGKDYKIKYSDYKFYKENNIKIGTTKRISGKIALPNREKAPEGGAYIFICIEIPNGDIYKNIYEKDLYIPEGKNSVDFSKDVPLNNSGYRISYWLDFEKECQYNYIRYGFHTINETTPDNYIANIEIPKANLIKGKISLANGELAPKGGVEVCIEAVLYKFATFWETGEEKYPTDSGHLIIPEGKNSIEYTLFVPPNEGGYYILYFIDDKGYEYREDGVNITRFYFNEKDTGKDTEANITLLK